MRFALERHSPPLGSSRPCERPIPLPLPIPCCERTPHKPHPVLRTPIPGPAPALRPAPPPRRRPSQWKKANYRRRRMPLRIQSRTLPDSYKCDWRARPKLRGDNPPRRPRYMLHRLPRPLLPLDAHDQRDSPRQSYLPRQTRPRRVPPAGLRRPRPRPRRATRKSRKYGRRANSTRRSARASRPSGSERSSRR